VRPAKILGMTLLLVEQDFNHFNLVWSKKLVQFCNWRVTSGFGDFVLEEMHENLLNSSLESATELSINDEVIKGRMEKKHLERVFLTKVQHVTHSK